MLQYKANIKNMPLPKNLLFAQLDNKILQIFLSLHKKTNKPWGNFWQQPDTAHSIACMSRWPTGRPLWMLRPCNPRSFPLSPGTSDGQWWESVRLGLNPPSSAWLPGLSWCTIAGQLGSELPELSQENPVRSSHEPSTHSQILSSRCWQNVHN